MILAEIALITKRIPARNLVTISCRNFIILIYYFFFSRRLLEIIDRREKDMPTFCRYLAGFLYCYGK